MNARFKPNPKEGDKKKAANELVHTLNGYAQSKVKRVSS
jgi:hypothetical protein